MIAKVIVFADGTCIWYFPADGVPPINGKWRSLDASQRQYLFKYEDHTEYTVTMAADGQRLTGTDPGSGQSVTAVSQDAPRVATAPDLSGDWDWPYLTKNNGQQKAEVLMKQDGTCTWNYPAAGDGGRLPAVHGTWRCMDTTSRMFVFRYDDGSAYSLTLSSDGQRLTGTDPMSGDKLSVTRKGH